MVSHTCPPRYLRAYFRPGERTAREKNLQGVWELRKVLPPLPTPKRKAPLLFQSMPKKGWGKKALPKKKTKHTLRHHTFISRHIKPKSLCSPRKSLFCPQFLELPEKQIVWTPFLWLHRGPFFYYNKDGVITSQKYAVRTRDYSEITGIIRHQHVAVKCNINATCTKNAVHLFAPSMGKLTNDCGFLTRRSVMQGGLRVFPGSRPRRRSKREFVTHRDISRWQCYLKTAAWRKVLQD